MKGYKGFDPGLVCRGKQYAENTVFEEDSAKICSSGMHFCQDPYEVLKYYPLINVNGEINDFAEVEALDEAKTDDNKKFCTKKLKIGAKLGLGGFVNACVNFLFEKTEFDKLSEDAKNASGRYSNLAASGDESNLAASGYASKLAASGRYSNLAASGRYSNLAASGDESKLAASGDESSVECSGEDSVICCAGHGSKAKAKVGCWITLAEWKYDEDKGHSVPVCVKTEFVDGEHIKEDTWYTLVNGEFQEVTEDA